MPKVGLRQEYEMTTRGLYTKVNVEFNIIVDGKELPSTAVLGKSFDELVQKFQADIKESYETVPERVPTPVTSQV